MPSAVLFVKRKKFRDDLSAPDFELVHVIDGLLGLNNQSVDAASKSLPDG